MTDKPELNEPWISVVLDYLDRRAPEYAALARAKIERDGRAFNGHALTLALVEDLGGCLAASQAARGRYLAAR